MDMAEKLACMVVLAMGTFFTFYQFIDWENKTMVLFGIGLVFIAWAVYAVVDNIRQSYTIVKKSYHD